MNKSSNQNSNLRTKMMLGILSATTFITACAQSPFDLSRLNANEKELYSSELLKQYDSRSNLATETTPGVSVGNTGTDFITRVAPPSDPCQLSGFQLYQDKNLDGQITTQASVNGVVSNLPICGPKESEVSLVINPVSKVDILAYDQPCDHRPDMMCPMMMRMNDVIVSGIVNGGFAGGAGSNPRATVKFAQMYLECESEAKQALALQLPLVIKGLGTGLANATSEVFNLSDITTCFVDRPAKGL